MNILEEGLKVQQAIVDANTRASNVHPIPTGLNIKAMASAALDHSKKPELERFIPENDTPLDAA